MVYKTLLFSTILIFIFIFINNVHTIKSQKNNNLNDPNMNLNSCKKQACMPKIANNAYDCYKIYKQLHSEINCNLFFSKYINVCTVVGDIDKDNCEGLRNTNYTRFYLDNTSKSILSASAQSRYLEEYEVNIPNYLNSYYTTLDMPNVTIYIDNRTIINSEYSNNKNSALDIVKSANYSTSRSICNYIIDNDCLNFGYKGFALTREDTLYGYCKCFSTYSGDNCEISPEQTRCNNNEKGIIKIFNEKTQKCNRICSDKRCGNNCEKSQEECECIRSNICKSSLGSSHWDVENKKCSCNCTNGRFGSSCEQTKIDYNCTMNYCLNKAIGKFNTTTNSCSCKCHSVDCGLRCNGYKYLEINELKCSVHDDFNNGLRLKTNFPCICITLSILTLLLSRFYLY
jgi:hypothetical protein